MSGDLRALKEEIIRRADFSGQDLLPAIVQDYKSGKVLMVAYVNNEALERTIETGYTWFYSRSRGELWNKGETSGNLQKVVSVALDCDNDAILIKVDPLGPSCHTGKESCFYNIYKLDDSYEALDEVIESGTAGVGDQAFEDMFYHLEDVIKKRLDERPEDSYVVKLNDKGENNIFKKLGEETAELIIALKEKERKEIVHEASDLVFHMMLSLKRADVSISEIIEELKDRHQERGR